MKIKHIMLAAALALAIASPAGAVDFATPMKKLDGTTLTKAEVLPGYAEDKTVFTLNDAVQFALLAAYQDEANSVDGTEKSKRFWLAKRINDQRKDPKLSAEEIATIKRLVGKGFNALVVGRAFELLDPAGVPKD